MTLAKFGWEPNEANAAEEKSLAEAAEAGSAAAAAEVVLVVDPFKVLTRFNHSSSGSHTSREHATITSSHAFLKLWSMSLLKKEKNSVK